MVIILKIASLQKSGPCGNSSCNHDNNVVVYLQYGIHNVVVEPRGVKDSPGIGIVHRDTKPANILLRTDHRSKLPHVDQGDSGQAICLDAFDMATGNANTWAGFLDWAPPEAPRHYFHSDTGSIGNVVQAMCRLVTSPPSMGPKRTYWGAGEEYSKRPRSRHLRMDAKQPPRPTTSGQSLCPTSTG